MLGELAVLVDGGEVRAAGNRRRRGPLFALALGRMRTPRQTASRKSCMRQVRLYRAIGDDLGGVQEAGKVPKSMTMKVVLPEPSRLSADRFLEDVVPGLSRVVRRGKPLLRLNSTIPSFGPTDISIATSRTVP